MLALAISLLPCTSLYAQQHGAAAASQPRAHRVNSAVQEIRTSLRLAGDSDLSQFQQQVTLRQGTAGFEGSAQALQSRVFSAAALVVDPAARELLDLVNRRVDAALQSTEADAGENHPSAAQILNALLSFSAAVALSSGERGLVTAHDVNSAVAGLCPLYPIC
ncbi:MAG TPA: hypothetical protein VK358_11830 [Longimicrobium sp.]|nr:hypothetical protein [Longimicrobium sp.]